MKTTTRWIRITMSRIGYSRSRSRKPTNKKRRLLLAPVSRYNTHELLLREWMIYIASQMISRDINTYTPSDASLNPDQFLPKLLMGETIQGFMTSRHRAARTRTEPIPRSFMNDFQFRNILYVFLLSWTYEVKYSFVFHRRQGGIRLSEQLNEDDLDLLVNFGLRSRFPEPCERWFQVRGSLREASQSERDKDVMIVNKDLDRHSALLEAAIEGAMVNVIMARYP